MKQNKLILVLTLLMSMVSLNAFADFDTSTKVQVGMLYYYLDKSNHYAQVTSKPNDGKYSGYVPIPASIEYNSINYTVTSIYKNAFKLSDVTTVIIANGVTSIGENAFEYCYKLASVTIPSSVTSIGDYAFEDCRALTSVIIPNGVTSIGEGAFWGCSGLISFTIPNSVTSIGIRAFGGCSGLTSITIPNSVASIGNNILFKCSNLTSIEVESGNAYYDSRDNCNAIIKTAANELIEGCKNTIIPNSVTSIGNMAFWGCSGLSSITIPNSVSSIGVSTFEYCSGLTSITIPNSVMSIGKSAFKGCSKLTSITIPNSVTSIDEYAFWECYKLNRVIINDIGAWCNVVFSGSYSNPLEFARHLYSDENTEITDLVIPNGVTTIGKNLFANCEGLTSVTIPNSVTSIGDNAFKGCSGLSSVTALNPSPATITQSVFSNRANATLYVPAGCKTAYELANNWKEFKEIVELTDYNFTFADSNVKAICIEHWDTDGDGLISFDEAAAVTTLSDYFRNKSITLFDELINFTGLTSIDSYAFDGCSGLTSITIPGSVTSIGSSAFNGCSGLTSVTIPNSVTSIGSSAFNSCSGLTSVTVLNPSPVVITGNAFSNRTTTTLYVPAGSKAAYEAANYWKDFKEIVEPTITFADSNVKAICVAHWDTNNDGEINFDEAAAVTTLSDIFKENTSITSFDELAYFTGLTSIDDYAFAYCDGLTSVTIPNSVKSIGSYAFDSCDNLTSVTISNGVMSIGEGAFAECYNLNKVIINDIGAWCNVVFSGSGSNPLEKAHHLYSDENTEITDLVIPNGVTTIGNEVFAYCDGLTSVTIPNSVTSIGDYAFYDCCDLNKVIINDVAAWCNIAFSESYSNPLYYAHHLYSDENTEITDLVIPNGVTTIRNEVFANCEGLTSVTIPNSVTSIGDNAFLNCSGLSSITIPSSIKSIGNGAFYDCCDLNKVIINDIGAWCNIVFSYYESNPLYYAHHLYSDENTEITDLVIPNGVTTIGNYAFAGSEGFTSVTIPSSVTSIGENAFQGCSGLTSIVVESENSKYDSRDNCNAIIETVTNKLIAGCNNTTIPSSVTSICDYAFYRCDGLVSITIPDNLTSIGDYAFSGCSGLTSVTVLNPLPVDITKDVFTNRANATLYVPTGSKEKYKTAEYWKQFKIINSNEPYAILSDNNTVLTFYYDYQKETRDGMDVGPFVGKPDFQNWYAQKESITKVVFDDSFANYTSLISTAFWFFGCNNLATITGIENLNTDNVIKMNDMFTSCSSLKSLDLSGFKTENVTDMSGMFSGCSGLTSLDLSGFKTENVTDMSWIFYGCSSLTNLDLSGFKTDKVTDMTEMFWGCSGLTKLDLSGFKTDNVTKMSYLFSGCSGLTSLDLSGFKTENVTDMTEMFSGCSGLTSLDLSGFKTENVTDMSGMFWSCSGLTSLDLSGFKTDNVTKMSYLFSGCSGLTSLDLSGFKTDKVTDMSSMFSGCSGLTSLDLSGFKTDNVTKMSYLFSGCSGLTKLDLSGFKTDKVTDMTEMFWGCSGLTSLDLSGFKTDKVTDMSSMFSGCSGLTSLDLSGFKTDKVTDMSGMFSGCSGLTSLDLSGFKTDKVTDMSSMFSGCSGLTSLDLSGFKTDNVTKMSYLFSGCSGLTSLDLSGFKADKVSDMSGIFSRCSGLTSITFPQNMTSIGDYAFYYCSSLTSITIPNSVTSIGDYAFNGCSGLASVAILNPSPVAITQFVFSNSVNATLYVLAGSKAKYKAASYWKDFEEIVEKYVFFADDNVRAICVEHWDTDHDGGIDLDEAAAVTTLSEFFKGNTSITSFNELAYFTSVTSIADNAFNGCEGLTSVTIPNSMMSIGGKAFYGCRSLTSITIPNSVTSIGYYAFWGCSGLTSITIPSSVMTIGNYSFSACSGLTSIEVESENSKYDSRDNCNAIIETATNRLIAGCRITTIPNGVTTIGNGAFVGIGYCTSITIPNSVTTIGDYAFYYCRSFTSITIPNSVTSIGSYAFDSCSGLTSITIPGSVTSIGERAFNDCSGLTSVTIMNPLPVTITQFVFSNSANATLYVPAGSKAKYKAANYWTDFKNIVEKYIYFADDNLKTICVEHWDTDHDGEISLVEAAKVTTLSTYFKFNASITSFNELAYFTSVTSIGYSAFNGCEGLTSVTIPNSVTSIGSSAFNGCEGLTSITIPNSVTSIGDGAFYGCSGLKWVRLLRSESVTMLYTKSVFNYCSSLKYIIVPEGAGYETAENWSNYAEKIRADKVTLFAENASNTLMSWCGQLTYIKPEGCTVYTIGSMTDNQVNLNVIDGDVIPAYTPVIIQRTEGSLNAPIKAEFKDVDYGKDLATTTVTGATMYGNTTETVVNTGGYYTKGKSYALYGDKFLLVDTDEGLPAHRCMLTLSSPAATRSLSIGGIEDGATSIDNGQLANDNYTDGTWYDLQGRKLDSKPTRKGLYIFNGKKMVIK